MGRPATNRLPSAIPTPVSGQLLLEIQYLSRFTPRAAWSGSASKKRSKKPSARNRKVVTPDATCGRYAELSVRGGGMADF
jgi:hypothetical protein